MERDLIVGFPITRGPLEKMLEDDDGFIDGVVGGHIAANIVVYIDDVKIRMEEVSLGG